MKPIQISEATARKLFKTIPDLKPALIDTFGDNFFSEKITDRIKTFEDACAETGDDPNNPWFNDGETDVIAFLKLRIITKALNPKDWKADYSNPNQRKWYPYFVYDKGSGFRFDVSGYGFGDADLAGGSRVSFATEELSNYAGTQFLEIYSQFINQ